MILKEQVLAVTDRRNDYEEAGAYYEGEVAEVFATAGLRRAMRKTGYRSRLNFCRPVVDAVQNRLEIAAVQGTSDTGSKVIDETWEFNELGLDSNEIHRWALVYGDCYAMVWPDEEGNIEISYNTPLTTTIVYDPEHPRRKLYALKMWESEDGTHLNVYGSDTVEKYFTSSKEVTEGAQWSQQDSVENPFGEVPVFHFRTMRPFGRPEHKDAFDAQNYINKQFIQSMITADYQGAPQRYALSKIETSSEIEDFEEGDTDRENMGALKNGPGEVWYMKGVDKVGEFKPADPAVFWTPIKDTVRSMASLTNTPLHYFEKTGNVPSGEALRVAEAPLIKKVADRKQSFGQSWRDLFKFVLKANGIEDDVQVKWVEVESLDELERLDAALKKRNEGISLQQVMREQGYDDEVIARVIAEAKEERDTGQVAGYERAANTNPEVRVQPENDERNV
jgi:hypothetical protein